MSLRELQGALVEMVLDKSSSGTLRRRERAGLGEAERRWLENVAGSAGFELTCRIARWWRHMRLEQSTPLTLAALAATGGRAVVDDHFDHARCTTLFFVPEALAFLEHVTSATRGPVVDAVARFERALLLASEAEVREPGCEQRAPRADTRVERAPRAALVHFPAPPVELLAALLRREPPPLAGGQTYPVLVAPGLPATWRPATSVETDVLRACEHGAQLRTLLVRARERRDVLRGLLAAGAIAFADG